MAIVREPLCDVRWGTASYYKDRWHTIDEALVYLLEKYPEFATDPRGQARVEGQQAFARAAGENNRAAWPLIRDVIRKGLEEAKGNYKIVCKLFNIESADYKKFLNFLRKHQCHMPFQQFRAGSTRPDAAPATPTPQRPPLVASSPW